MSQATYFEFVDTARPKDKPFFFQLMDPSQIQKARNIINGTEKRDVHPSGTVVQEKVDYNPYYNFHLEPSSIHFFEQNIEVCDSSAPLIDEQLDEVGGSFLPGSHWCPWHSKLTRELNSEEIKDLTASTAP